MTTQSLPARSVALNAHLLSLSETYRGAGISGYIHELLRCLPAADAGLTYTAYFHAAGFIAPAGLRISRSHWDTGRPWRRIVWEQTRLAAHSRHYALLHGLAYATPLAAACPTVVTIHDLSFIRFPKAFRPPNRLYLRWMTGVSVRKAARVIAVSESTRQDVIRYYGVPEERIITIPNGVNERFRPADPAGVTAFRQRHGLPERFILFLGTLEPRKNLLRLIDAYALWRQMHELPHKLVIAGAKGWYYEEVFAHVSEIGLDGAVIFPGFVAAEELPWWYQAAELFIYPSLFEGFGLPVLEAMACGTPTITSTASSLPEVAADAALLVSPEDTSALATAMQQVLGDPELAVHLRTAGLRRAAAFSWTRTAQATAGVYRAVMGGSQ